MQKINERKESITDNQMYICDPNKNIECCKTGCFINGGPCYKTSKIEYQLYPSSHLIKEELKVCGRCVYEKVNENDEPCLSCTRNVYNLQPDNFIPREEYRDE